MKRVMAAMLALFSGCDRPAAKAPVASAKQAMCGQASDETVRIMNALAPTCAGCHMSGTRAFWASVGAFQNLVVSDPSLVVPGDPDGSEFVRLLEGAGRGAFKQMPIGTNTYAALLADGTATLPIADVKAWITGLATQARDARPDPAAARITRVRPEQVQRALYQQLGLGYDDFFTDAFDFGIPHAQTKGDDAYPFQPDDAYRSPRTSEVSDRFHGLGGGSVVGQQRADPSIAPTFVLTLTQVSQRWCRLAFNKQGNLALFPAGTTKAVDEANVKATIARWFLHFHGTRATPADIDTMYSTVWSALSAQGAEVGFTGLCSAFIRHPDWIFY